MWLKKSLHLLTDKPILYVGNIGETDLQDKKISKHIKDLTEHVKNQNNSIIFLCASLEQEISLLGKNEQQMFLSEYNLKEPGLNKVIRSSFELLGLHTFFTCGDKEGKSWTIKKGMNALIMLNNSLEIAILDRIEVNLVNFLREALSNDKLVLQKEIREDHKKNKIFTSKDKYDFMVKEQPLLQKLKDKLGLDFEY